MIQVTSAGLQVSVSGAVVYLDNWAVIELAKKDPSRRSRFIDIVHSGIDVLFSVTNAAELSGPQGRSADAIKLFLDEIGPRWFPARLDVTAVMKDELMGVSPEKACIDETSSSPMWPTKCDSTPLAGESHGSVGYHFHARRSSGSSRASARVHFRNLRRVRPDGENQDELDS